MLRTLCAALFAAFALAAAVPKVAADSSSSAKDCHCDDSSPHGFAFKGRVIAVFPEQGTLRISFNGIPGVMPAGTQEFKAAPQVLAVVRPGREILARIERRRKIWWIFDVRLLIPLPSMP